MRESKLPRTDLGRSTMPSYRVDTGIVAQQSSIELGWLSLALVATAGLDERMDACMNRGYGLSGSR